MKYVLWSHKSCLLTLIGIAPLFPDGIFIVDFMTVVFMLFAVSYVGQEWT